MSDSDHKGSEATKSASKPEQKKSKQPARRQRKNRAVIIRPSAKPAAPRPAEPTNLFQLIMQATRDPRVDAEKLKTLIGVQTELEEREAKKAFTRAFNELQFELPTINKDANIDHGEGKTAKGNPKLKAMYSSYPNLMRVCRPLLKKHGFTFHNIVEPFAEGARIVVVAYLTHIAGHTVVSRFPLSLDDGPGRSNAQAWGSSSSYGKRYNLMLMLDIVSEAKQDLDDDNRKRPKDERIAEAETVTPNELSKAQIEELKNAISHCGVKLDTFLHHYKIDSIETLPPKLFKEAILACSNYARKRHDEEALRKINPTQQND